MILVTVDGCPEVNMGVNGIRIPNQSFCGRKSHDIGMEENKGANTVKSGSCFVTVWSQFITVLRA
jgi:hypothetical protein